jgi:hypothetical protein
MTGQQQLDAVAGLLHGLRQDGWVLIESAVDRGLVARLAADLERACETCHRVQVANGVDAGNGVTAHHLVGQGASFLDFLRRGYCDPVIRAFLGGNYILNSLGGVINRREDGTYVHRVHRDVRSFTGDFKLMLNMLVMLDDFTLDNGATCLGTGTHLQDARPADDAFFASAHRAVGPSGSIVLFDSNLWHSAGVNRTDSPRRAITPTFTRPFVKQQLDYPRLLGYERGSELPDDLRRVLGYDARVPATLDEWYQPPEKRFYKPGQG